MLSSYLWFGLSKIKVQNIFAYMLVVLLLHLLPVCIYYFQNYIHPLSCCNSPLLLASCVSKWPLLVSEAEHGPWSVPGFVQAAEPSWAEPCWPNWPPFDTWLWGGLQSAVGSLAPLLAELNSCCSYQRHSNYWTMFKITNLQQWQQAVVIHDLLPPVFVKVPSNSDCINLKPFPSKRRYREELY